MSSFSDISNSSRVGLTFTLDWSFGKGLCKHPPDQQGKRRLKMCKDSKKCLLCPEALLSHFPLSCAWPTLYIWLCQQYYQHHGLGKKARKSQISIICSVSVPVKEEHVCCLHWCSEYPGAIPLCWRQYSNLY